MNQSIENNILTQFNPIEFRTNPQYITSIHNYIKTDDDIELIAKIIYEYDFFNGQKGNIYCMHTKIFDNYGDNVYRLGTVQFDIINPSFYIDECVYLATSREYTNCLMAKDILFHLLKQYIMVDGKDFVNCEIGVIISAFDNVTNMNEKNIDLIYLDTYMDKIKVQIKSVMKNI